MGGRRRKKKQKKGGVRKASTPAPVVVAPATPEPPVDTRSAWRRFWDDREVHPAQLRLFRFVFYALVAADSFLELEHAPRYGAGGFNVSHFPALDGLLPLPDRRIMVLLWLGQGFLALRMALGAGSKRTAWLLTAAFGATYFWSQLDSYQHHYLLFLLLGMAACVDWNAERPPTWPVRLILCQVSIVYLWTAITKMQPLWLDGTLIARQVPSGPVPDMVARIAGTVGMETTSLWAVMAVGVLIAELSLVVGLHVERLRLVALALGLALHGGIEYAGFKIGLFSYFMFAIYLLVVPPRFFRNAGPPRTDTRDAPWWWLAAALALGSAAVGTLFPIEGVWLTVALASAWALAEEFPPPVTTGRRRRAWVHAVSCVVLLALSASTDVLRDYWKYRGGDTRRRGEVKQAVAAYEAVVAIDPGYASGHARLSDLYRRSGELQLALAEARTAERLDPREDAHPARAARIQKLLGDTAAARQSAQRAIELGNKDDDIAKLAR